MNKSSIFFLILALIIFSTRHVSAVSPPFPIPDTGETKCYDVFGNEINPCPSPGQPFYGQDGNYTINSLSYTKLDADGNDLPYSANQWTMVRDNVTGLIWEVKTADNSIHDSYQFYNWYDAQDIFITQLNADKFGGYSDWRLPTREELNSIVDFGKYYPVIDKDYFPNTAYAIAFNFCYWSSTAYAYDTNYAWTIFFSHVGYYDYNCGPVNKTDSLLVRAVRGEHPNLSNRFAISGNGTVTDTQTGLMWQQNDSNSKMSWKNALAYCENLSLAGYEDWRLPNIKELVSHKFSK